MRQDNQTALAPAEVVVRQEGETVVIGDKASVTTSRHAEEAPKTAEELERVMQGMGRDPRTGEPSSAPTR
jgi:hypothetical protein